MVKKYPLAEAEDTDSIPGAGGQQKACGPVTELVL